MTWQPAAEHDPPLERDRQRYTFSAGERRAKAARLLNGLTLCSIHMRGICSRHPGGLAEALAPITDRCEQLDWAVDLYSGPLRFPYYVEEEPGNVLAYHQAEAGRVQSMHWFERGFLPRHADCLIMDEWSCYLAFDSRTVSAAELAVRLETDLSPRPLLFDVVVRENLLYLFRVDVGWWEAYTPDAELLERLRQGWAVRECGPMGPPAGPMAAGRCGRDVTAPP